MICSFHSLPTLSEKGEEKEFDKILTKMERSMKRSWAKYLKTLPQAKPTHKKTKTPKKLKGAGKKKQKKQKKKAEDFKLPHFKSSTPPDSITISKRDDDGNVLDPVTINGKHKTSQFFGTSPYDYYGEDDPIPEYEFESRGMKVPKERSDHRREKQRQEKLKKKEKKKEKGGWMNSGENCCCCCKCLVQF